MHEYFTDDLKYVADAIVETRPAWDSIDVKSEDEAIGLPYHVIERLAITHRRMKEEPGFTGFRELIHTLSASERPDEQALATMFKRFKDLLVTLAEADVEPFLARRETAIEIIESSMRGGDWQAVDSELRYLQHSAERYWRYASNEPPAQPLNDRDLKVLHSVAKTINREGHNRRIQECQTADGFRNRAYDKMQMLLEVLDNLNLLR
jgi:hypothetical protein